LEYPKIVDLVNEADSVYLGIYSKEMAEEMYISSEMVDNLIDGEDRREYVCIYKNEDLVGFASFYLKNSQTVWLSMFHIDPEYQKQGLGSIFLKKIEEQAKKLKALVIVLETDKKATWAVNFYKKNNYQILSDEDLTKYHFDKALEKKQVEGRYIFGKKL